MGSDDTARRAKDMSIVLDALTLWLKAEGAAGHRSGISVETEELMNLMGSQFGLNSVDHHLLNISIKLVEANELKVAFVQLRSTSGSSPIRADPRATQHPLLGQN